MRGQPFIGPASPARGPRSGPRRSFDWRRAARLYAAGIPGEEVAATLNIPEEHFWRHLDRSPRFRCFIDRALAEDLQRSRDEFVNLVRNKLQISTR
jgi:hypothetical protein